MSIQRLTLCLASAGALLLSTACVSNDPAAPNDTLRLDIRAQYQKRMLSPSGFSPNATPLPIRRSWYQVRNADSGQVLAENLLDNDGRGTATLPKGANAYVAVFAQFELPAASGNTFFMRGSVKRGTPLSSYSNIDAFNAIPDWYLTSDSAVLNGDSQVTVTALESPSSQQGHAGDGLAGAFAISDQMLRFAESIQALEPSLAMPNFHAFWGPTCTGTAYPSSARTTGGSLLQQASGRVAFQQEIRYASPKALDRGADAYNDGVLQESFARLLFDDASLDQGNGSFGPIIRRDNDNAWVGMDYATEGSLAFVSGYASFLGSAFRGDPTLCDVAADGNVSTYRLDLHSVAGSIGGEFYPGSVARSLWGIWTNPGFASTSYAGLRHIWDATNPNQVNQDLEYGSTPLATYPSFLRGLTRISGLAAQAPIQAELALEDIGHGLDPTSTAYFNSDAQWVSIFTKPAAFTGSLTSYATNVFYDLDQAQSFRIVHGGGSLTLSVTTGSPGAFLELFDSNGPLAWAEARPTATLQQTLPVGSYVARLRVDPYLSHTDGSISYSLTVQ